MLVTWTCACSCIGYPTAGMQTGCRMSSSIIWPNHTTFSGTRICFSPHNYNLSHHASSGMKIDLSQFNGHHNSTQNGGGSSDVTLPHISGYSARTQRSHFTEDGTSHTSVVAFLSIDVYRVHRGHSALYSLNLCKYFAPFWWVNWWKSFWSAANMRS